MVTVTHNKVSCPKSSHSSQAHEIKCPGFKFSDNFIQNFSTLSYSLISLAGEILKEKNH
jgi:hypothetical protein